MENEEGTSVDVHQLWTMHLTLSKKEVAEIHLMLTTLPIPPIPVSVVIKIAGLPDGDKKTAFEMATAPIVKDSQSEDGIVNSHSIFAAMSFFQKWSTDGSDKEKQEEIKDRKDASLLLMIQDILNLQEVTKDTGGPDDSAIFGVFIKSSQAWINCYLPEEISISISSPPLHTSIGFEHDLHISMSHYCYAQGVLYNNKASKSLLCQVHENLCIKYEHKKKQDEQDDDEDDQEKDDNEDYLRQEHVEIAAMYSQFTFDKMMLLCFQRLLKDSLYGHTMQPSNPAEVSGNARELLKISFENYEKMTKRSVASRSSQSTEVTLKRPIRSPSETLTPKPVSTDNDSDENLVKPFSSDIGSYKSSAGIFVLSMVNFINHDDPYYLQNMQSSLRHLYEFLDEGNENAKKACMLINIPALIAFVRQHIHTLPKNSTLLEIDSSLLCLETILADKYPHANSILPLGKDLPV